MAMTLQQNMGQTDRIVRGGMGAAMLALGLIMGNRTPLCKVRNIVGGAFLAYGLTGFDPLLAAFGVTTKPGDPNHVMKVAKQAIPGQGVKPMESQQPVPAGEIEPFNESQSLAENLAIH